MKTLVLGIGNSILGDDGVGVRVAQELAGKIKNDNIDVRDVGIDGLNLLELILGYDKLIVIDAVLTEREKVGEVYRFKPEKVYDPSRSAISPHHFNLATTIEIGKKLFPGRMPKEVIAFAVGTEEATMVTEEMTGRVKNALPIVVNLVLEELNLN
ncbi:MAG: hydrogenase maturation protease [Dehalococcoidales bacterium]|nr:hydrogenase maturation protease [Dehalococcoidales bacterium]